MPYSRSLFRPLFGVAVSLLIAVVLLKPAYALEAADRTMTSKLHDFKLVTIANDLQHPWGVAFLRDGSFLVTERIGRLNWIRPQHNQRLLLTGLPDNIEVSGQGGLLDVALHPDFENTGWVYFSYSARDGHSAGTQVARARLNNRSLQQLEVIFKASPKTAGTRHYGSRLLFLPDRSLLITVGDRGRYLKEAQNLSNDLGTLIRIRDDGSVPKNNPFVNKPAARSHIYSYGHRNAQGLALEPQSGRIWLHEHGPRGGDELNLIEAGKNYGWPAITYGIDYDGTLISRHSQAAGMEQPVTYWVPSIAPSGMAFYHGNKFKRWQGHLFLGALAQQHLRRLKLQDRRVIEQEVLLKGMARIRDVRSAPDGYLYLLTDQRQGKLLRLEPAH